MSETISFSSHYIHVYFLLSDNNCTCPAALAEKCRPSAACKAYVCSSGVYSLYWIKGNNVAWFYVETNMRLNRIRHRHYPLSNTLTK